MIDPMISTATSPFSAKLAEGELNSSLQVGIAGDAGSIGKGNDPCGVGDEEAIAAGRAGILATTEVPIEAVLIGDRRRRDPLQCRRPNSGSMAAAKEP